MYVVILLLLLEKSMFLVLILFVKIYFSTFPFKLVNP